MNADEIIILVARRDGLAARPCERCRRFLARVFSVPVTAVFTAYSLYGIEKVR